VVIGVALVFVLNAGAALASEKAPDPGGSDSANLRLPPPGGKLFGVNGVYDFVGVTPGAILDQLGRSGANAARRTLSWSSVEPSHDRWNEAAWASASRFYSAALERGMTPIFGLGFAPPWARDFPHQLCGSQSCAFPPARSQIGEWAEFAAQVTARFPRATLELWNEPNSPIFWKPSPSPGRWAELVVAGYNAIKRVNPGAQVIICGCAGTIVGAKPEHGIPAHQFLAQAYEHNPSIAGHHDGISFHFFPQAYGRNPFKFGPGTALAKLIENIRTVLAGHGDRGADLWLDEVGYWTKDLQPYVGRPVSEQEAARGLSRFARRLLTMPDIKALLVHRELDGDGGLDRYAIRDSSFGLLRRRPVLDPKPSACRFAAMAGRYSLAGCPDLKPPRTRVDVITRRERSVTLGLRGGPGETRFECKLRGKSWHGCRRTTRVGPLAPGRHIFRARAYRADGTQDETPARQVIRIR
jgi:hypothetical protein